MEPGVVIIIQIIAKALDVRKVKLPFMSVAEAKEHILKIENQYGVPCAWYQADVHGNDANIQREFYIIPIGTGHDWGDDLHRDEYLGSTLLYNDTLVLHYFLIEI